MPELTRISATGQRALIERREVSAVELFQAHAARIEACDGAVKAFVTLGLESGLAAARACDAQAARGEPLGPLHGLPVAVKDTFPTAGLRTTYGSRAYADHVPNADALHVARIKAAGAVVIGKSNTPEFACGGQTTNLVAGTTRNPLDLSRTVAGSSGGAAAALAAGMAPLADGSDLGGSLRSPAAWCGVVGFRPTSGLVPYLPTALPFNGHHTPGPMARSVADAALLLAAMAGPTPAAPLSRGARFEAPNSLERDLRGLRIAWCLAPGGSEPVPEVRQALAPARDLLESLGCRVETAQPDLVALPRAHQVFRCLSAATQIGPEVAAQPELFGATIRAILEKAASLTLENVAEAQRCQARGWEAACAFFERYDLMVWPSASGLAYGADLAESEIKMDWTPVELTPLLQLPAISVPFGRTGDGLPAGLQVIGRRHEDLLVLQCAQAIERGGDSPEMRSLDPALPAGKSPAVK